MLQTVLTAVAVLCAFWLGTLYGREWYDRKYAKIAEEHSGEDASGFQAELEQQLGVGHLLCVEASKERLAFLFEQASHYGRIRLLCCPLHYKGALQYSLSHMPNENLQDETVYQPAFLTPAERKVREGLS